MILAGNCEIKYLGCLIVNLFPDGFNCDNDCGKCRKEGLLLKSNEVSLYYDFVNSTINISLKNGEYVDTIQNIYPGLFIIDEVKLL